MSLTRIGIALLSSEEYTDIGRRLTSGAVEIFQTDVGDSVLSILNGIVVPIMLILLLIFIAIYGAYIGIHKKNGGEDIGVHTRNLIVAFVVFVALGSYAALATDLISNIIGR